MYFHKPILAWEIKNAFSNNPIYPIIKSKNINNKTIVDCTAGEGGHSAFLLPFINNSNLILLDRDVNMLLRAKKRILDKNNALLFLKKDYHKNLNKLYFYNKNFSAIKYTLKNTLKNTLTEKPYPDKEPYKPCVDYFLFDLGISMFHYKMGARGFSFNDTNSLDMRLDTQLDEYDNAKKPNQTAYDIINSYRQEDIIRILKEFADEDKAFFISREIIKRRAIKKIDSSYELANIVSHAKRQKRHIKTHPATKTFQALRIYVNQEFYHIERGLIDAIYYLKEGGRIAILTFHSLEDRIVKNILKYFELSCICPITNVCQCLGRATLKRVNKNVIRPGEDEKALNPASRSTKLRVVEKVYEEQDPLKKEDLFKNAKKVLYKDYSFK